MNGGILAALLIHALLAQSAAGGIASASMMRASLAHSGVDFVTSDPIHRDHDGSHGLHERCAVLCQTACRVGTGFLPDTIRTYLGSAHVALLAAPVIARPDSFHPRRLGIRHEARAPPHLSA